jgi:NOL1/NOP2/fmu family ribosome biogenesis protein
MSDLIGQQDSAQIIEALCERFGISESVFENCLLYYGSKGKVYLRNSHSSEIKDSAVIGLHIATVAKVVKPSTNFIQIFGKHFRRNVISVSNSDARELIAGLEEFPAPTAPEDVTEEVTDGYVALSCDSQPILCGFLKNGVVRNMLPKSRRRVLKFI